MIFLGLPLLAQIPSPAKGWTRHTIDASSRGADGVRLDDWNRDGLPDIVTGWEEGGVVRIYLHPGHGDAQGLWPRMDAGAVGDPEDAVFADLDGDGRLDVVSAAEGKTRALSVHWSPPAGSPLDAGAWQREPFPVGPRQQWMFALPMDLDGKPGVELVAGGKGDGAQLGWFAASANPRELAGWTWHPLRDLGWLMSLVAADMDGDGDSDILLTDRKGLRRGVAWLENPGVAAVRGPWKEHTIGSVGEEEVMFLAYGDLDDDQKKDVIVATKPQHLAIYRRLDTNGTFDTPVKVAFPANTGTAKGIAVGDIDGDGIADLVFSCEHATGEKRGVMALLGSRVKAEAFTAWIDISGEPGTKFDLVQLVDLDGDGDLDVLTCEETENLGVIWYENPGRRR
jgi:hypothetical protein